MLALPVTTLLGGGTYLLKPADPMLLPPETALMPLEIPSRARDLQGSLFHRKGLP